MVICLLTIVEFRFTSLLLSKHYAKSAIWAHRFWLKSKFAINESTDVFLLAAQRYPKNYPAWTYRMKTIGFNLDLQSLNQELELTKHFILSSISDYSAWSYRQFLLAQIIKTELAESIWTVEFNWTHELIIAYPVHEAFFAHLHFLIKNAKNVGYDISNELYFLKSLGKTQMRFPLQIILRNDLISGSKEISKDPWVRSIIESNCFISHFVLMKLGMLNQCEEENRAS
jgi:hypothetical protein